MSDGRTAVGILLFLLVVISLGVKYFRAPKAARMPWWGWVGLAIVAGAEALLFLESRWISIFFTPIVWTGYLLLADALVWSLAGRSRLGNAPRQFLSLAFWSVPLWLVFEAYNLRLANWEYVGLPDNPVLTGLGYVWSFATIWPAIFETADLLRAQGVGSRPAAPRQPFRPSTRTALFVAGVLCLLLPIVVPVRLGRYLFGAVWIGFVLALDPLNYRWLGRSLLRQIEAGERSTILSLLGAGLVCGILWEFWNYWAAARWVYVFPIMQEWKIFEMPLAGYFGFPAFALECFVMYEFLVRLRSYLREANRRRMLDIARSTR